MAEEIDPTTVTEAGKAAAAQAQEAAPFIPEPIVKTEQTTQETSDTQTETEGAEQTTKKIQSETYTPTQKEIDSVRHMNKPERNSRQEEEEKHIQEQIKKANAEGKPLGVRRSEDGKLVRDTIYMPEGYQSNRAKGNGGNNLTSSQDHAANTKTPGTQEPQKTWWERNKEWLLWTLGGLALGTVAILGFRKGGWWNKRKSTPSSSSSVPVNPDNPNPDNPDKPSNDLGDHITPDNGDGPSVGNNNNNNTLAGAGTQLKDTTLPDLTAEQKKNWIDNYRQNN